MPDRCRSGEDSALPSKDLASYFSLSQAGLAERGRQVMHAAGLSAHDYPDIHLGSPDLLVSARRKEIIEVRDRHVDG